MTPLRSVWLATVAYALVYFALGWDRYATYHSGSDLGLFTQSIASAFAGFSNTTEGGNHFTFHFSPLLFVCAPLLLLTRSPLALVAIAAVACALVAPPLFALARKRMPERLALGVALTALLYPPLAGVTFADFHENVFAPALTLALLWALDARRFAWAAAFAALALCIKEDQATILGFDALLGLAFYLRRRDRSGALFAAGLCAASAVVFVLFFEVVRPLAGARDVWGPTHFYTWSRIVDPRGSAPWYSVGRPAYFLEALVPLSFAPLASPAFLLALPAFGEVLASHESIVYTMGQHYAAVWIGYVLFAFALAIGSTFARAPRTARVLVRTSLVLCALVLALASPTHWGHYLRARNAHDALLDRAVARLTPDANVGTLEEIYSHLGFDPQAELGLARDPHYALLDTELADSVQEERWEPFVRAGLARGQYRVVWRDGSVTLYERTGGALGAGPKAAR
jgi:uncharacterized membrane protein